MLVIAMVKVFCKEKSRETDEMYLKTLLFCYRESKIAGTYLSAMHAKQLRCENI